MSATEFNPVFLRVMEMIFRHEGGLVDDPRDPGGITNMGISLAAFPELGVDGIKTLTKDQALYLYWKRYWFKAGCDRMREPVAFVVMDAAVNSGVTKALRWYADALPLTPVKDFIDRYCALRLTFLQSVPSWKTFGKGWAARIADTKACALASAEAIR